MCNFRLWETIFQPCIDDLSMVQVKICQVLISGCFLMKTIQQSELRRREETKFVSPISSVFLTAFISGIHGQFELLGYVSVTVCVSDTDIPMILGHCCYGEQANQSNESELCICEQNSDFWKLKVNSWKLQIYYYPQQQMNANHNQMFRKIIAK